MRIALLVLLLCWGPAARAQTFSSVAAAEKGVQQHDKSLANLVTGLEDWLTGRSELAAFRKVIAGVKTGLTRPLALPKNVSSQVSAAEQGVLKAVGSFLAEKEPDAEGQRALLQSLNGFTHDRSLALLAWRETNNRALLAANKGKAAQAYLKWESAWLKLWKSETEITYRLQKDVLSSGKSQGIDGALYVRELLALQTKAAAVSVPPAAEALQDMAVRRLTLLARTAEQLGRLGRGESRGALTRVRRLNKEQAELSSSLQEKRLALLSTLAKK